MEDMKSAFKKAGFKEQETKVHGSSAEGKKYTAPQQPEEQKNSFRTQDSTALQSHSVPQNNTASRNLSQLIDLSHNYTEKAEQVILNLKREMGRDYDKFTTSKIRNILSMITEIYNDVLNEKGETLNSNIQSRIERLKVRLIYECGREPNVVRPFVEKAGLIQIISGIGSSKTKFNELSCYMEALVAYHRYYGGKD